jgi:hypothetical protein
VSPGLSYFLFFFRAALYNFLLLVLLRASRRLSRVQLSKSERTMLPQMNRNLNSEELVRRRKKGKQCGRSDNPNSFLFCFVLESTKEGGGFRFV